MRLPEVKNTLRQNRGLAIIMTLMIITLLVSVVMEINQRVRAGGHSAMLFRDRMILSQMAMSGINIGRAILVDDKKNTETDSLQETWADPEAVAGIVARFPFENGRVDLKITDLRGRIQVNALVDYPDGVNFNENQKLLWYRFWQLIDAYEGIDYDIEPMVIINAVKDWLDANDDGAVTGLEGAESDYYQSLNPPYSCRNGPIIDINELALVKGIAPEIFLDPESGAGLAASVTTFGMTDVKQGEGFTFDGKININTAPSFVVSALLPLEDAHLGQEIVAYRSETSNDNFVHDLSDVNWYKNVPGCSELNIAPDLITVSSDFFQIEATAIMGETKLTRTVVARREKDAETGQWYCRVLNCR